MTVVKVCIRSVSSSLGREVFFPQYKCFHSVPKIPNSGNVGSQINQLSFTVRRMDIGCGDYRFHDRGVLAEYCSTARTKIIL